MWAATVALERAAGFTPYAAEARRREELLRKARQALGPDPARAAEERGAAMGLATAAEFALLLTAPGPQQAAASPGLGKLSARERELVILVARGRTDAQIAQQLYISVRTVRSHLDRIRDKTGCRRRADLTRLALTAGRSSRRPPTTTAGAPAVGISTPQLLQATRGNTASARSDRPARQPVTHRREASRGPERTGAGHVHPPSPQLPDRQRPPPRHARQRPAAAAGPPAARPGQGIASSRPCRPAPAPFAAHRHRAPHRNPGMTPRYHPQLAGRITAGATSRSSTTTSTSRPRSRPDASHSHPVPHREPRPRRGYAREGAQNGWIWLHDTANQLAGRPPPDSALYAS